MNGNPEQKNLIVGAIVVIVILASVVLGVVGKPVPSWFEAVALLSVGYMVGQTSHQPKAKPHDT